MPGSASEADSGVTGNQRLTAMAGAVLLVLTALVIATAAYAHGLLPTHIFVGVWFLGPLAVMAGSTGYRVLRYYTGSPAFLRRGKPLLALRLLAWLLLLSTILVVASGLALFWTGPGFLPVHVFTALFWLPVVVTHAVAHSPRIPGLIADEWRSPVSGRWRRLGVISAAVVTGVVAAIAIQPLAAPMIARSRPLAFGVGPFIVGMIISAVAVIIARPLRWS